MLARISMLKYLYRCWGTEYKTETEIKMSVAIAFIAPALFSHAPLSACATPHFGAGFTRFCDEDAASALNAAHVANTSQH